MKRAARSHAIALPLVGVIRSPEEALSVSARIAETIRTLSGRARLAHAAELEELCRALESRILTLEQGMAQLRQDLERGRQSASACIAYASATRPSC